VLVPRLEELEDSFFQRLNIKKENLLISNKYVPSQLLPVFKDSVNFIDFYKKYSKELGLVDINEEIVEDLLSVLKIMDDNKKRDLIKDISYSYNLIVFKDGKLITEEIFEHLKYSDLIGYILSKEY